MSEKIDYVGLGATGVVLGTAAYALKVLAEDGLDFFEQLEENIKKSKELDENGNKKKRPWWQAG